MPAESEGPFFFHYRFTLNSGALKEFRVELDPATLQFIPKKKDAYPAWTGLDYCKCSHCPLDSKIHERCPIAANLTDVIDFAKDAISYEEADVEIETASRTYKKRAALQHGVSSLMGIVMVTSGCPVMDKLRPMVRTHLPFAQMEETIYRLLSMYLLAQFFLWKKGGVPDWELKGLIKVFEDIETLNQFFWKRLKGVHSQDAGLNAVAHLDVFAQFTHMLVQEGRLDEIERLFKTYFDGLI